MQSLESNKQTIFYATFIGYEEVMKDGYKTGQKNKTYSEPKPFRCNVSYARGNADVDEFGINTDYDKQIVTNDLNCPIEEDTILWVGRPTTEPHNYKVMRKAQSINSVTYAIKEVSVS